MLLTSHRHFRFRDPAAALVLLLGWCALSCSSGSRTPPSGPQTPDGLTIDYCRVIDAQGEMHVQWSANRATSGEIRYGRGAYSALARFPQSGVEHDHLLLGLDWSTTYIYELRLTDSLGTVAVCGGEFATPAKAQPEPAILGLTITNIGETSAVVAWRTDEPASTILYYGAGAVLDSVTLATPSLLHDVTLSGLTEETRYTVRAEAVDTSGLRGIGADTSFVTAARMNLRFDPLTIVLGDTATLNIYVENAADLAALQYVLEFDAGQLEVVELAEGSFFTDHDGFAFFRGIGNSRGEVTNHMTWSIEYAGNNRVGTGADGNGVVAQLLIRGVQPGDAHAAFAADSTFGLDMYAARRACDLSAGTIIVQP